MSTSLVAESLRLKSLGYVILPVGKYKNALTTEWNSEHFDFDPSRLISGQTGIAILCGERSGVVCVDIDVDDEAFINEIISIAPTSVTKRGGKGLSLFYAWDKSLPQGKSSIYYINSLGKEASIIDFLMANSYSIMPPSKYFTKSGDYLFDYKYTNNISLPEKEFLPSLSIEMFNKMQKAAERFKSLNCHGGKIIVNENSGRNNKLSKMASAALFNNKDLPTQELLNKVAKEIYDYDKEKHTPRLFSDKSERFQAKNEDETFANALKFTQNIFKSILPKMLEEQEIVEPLEMVQNQFAYKEYPTPDGALAILQNYILDSSYTHNPNMALGAALATIGITIGNKISFDGTFANDYYILLSPAGGGKSSAINAIKKTEIISDEKLYPGSFTSSQAVIKTVFDNCEILSTNDELSKLLKQIKNGNEWQQGIVQELASIWSSSGKRYELQAQSHKTEDERKNAKKFVINPFMSFLGATTFSELMENVDSTFFSSGLFPRCLFFIDKERRDLRKVFLNDEDIEESSKAVGTCLFVINTIVKECLSKSRTAAQQMGYDFSDNTEPSPCFNIKLNDETIKAIINVDEKLEHLRESTDSEYMKLMIDRGIEHVKKLALIAAVAEMGQSIDIKTKHIEWAFELFKTSLHNAEPTFRIASSKNYNEKLSNTVLKVIKERGPISLRDLCRTMTIKKKMVEEIIEDLIFKGYVGKTEDKFVSGRQKYLYFFINTEAG